MRHAVFLPPFGELSDPRVVADLAATAEASGWDGVFLWDHVLRPPDEPAEIADAWVCLAAAAMTTTTIRLGPMITPVTRRRPQVLARQTVSLDHLSGGRLTLGLGLGVDSGGELSKFGETVDAVTRGNRLDEGLDLLTALWSGDEITHHGEHFQAEAVRFLPRPVQEPRIPLWLAARGDARRPVRRAARYDGLFPIEVDEDGLARMLDLVVQERGDLDGFDVAVTAAPGVDLEALARRGATWAMWSYLPGEPAALIRSELESGPDPATLL